MRQDYDRFLAHNAEILSIGPETLEAFQRYWQENALPFLGLADPRHTVAKQYGQQVRLLKLGRMPALMIVDRAGRLRYEHFGESMSDIPANADVLAILDQLNGEKSPGAP